MRDELLRDSNQCYFTNERGRDVEERAKDGLNRLIGSRGGRRFLHGYSATRLLREYISDMRARAGGGRSPSPNFCNRIVPSFCSRQRCLNRNSYYTLK